MRFLLLYRLYHSSKYTTLIFLVLYYFQVLLNVDSFGSSTLFLFKVSYIIEKKNPITPVLLTRIQLYLISFILSYLFYIISILHSSHLYSTFYLYFCFSGIDSPNVQFLRSEVLWFLLFFVHCFVHSLY